MKPAKRCSILVLVAAAAVGCGSNVGSGSSSTASDGKHQLLDTVVNAIGQEHFTDLRFGSPTDLDVAKPGDSWLYINLPEPVIGSGTENYWATVVLEEEFNHEAAAHDVEAVAGITITSPDGTGKFTSDGQLEDSRPTAPFETSQNEIRDQITAAVSGSGAKLTSLSFVGVNSAVPVVRLQTDDPQGFVAKYHNPYYGLLGEMSLEAGYVEVRDGSGGVILAGGVVPGEGFTTTWVRFDLDWHTFHNQDA